jgi:hypothetical protein
MYTLSEINQKLTPFLNKKFNLPITKNKGLPGLFLESILGINPTSNCLDCTDGELKLFPLKQLKRGKGKEKKRTWVPKESIAVTMLNINELKENNFYESKCFKKLSRLLMVSYIRDNDIIQFTSSTMIQLHEHKDVCDVLESDYNNIRKGYIENNKLESKTGIYLQNRTKGAGGTAKKTRAFYLRPSLIQLLCRPEITVEYITNLFAKLTIK